MIGIAEDFRVGEGIITLLCIVVKGRSAQDMVRLIHEPFELRRRNDEDGFAGEIGEEVRFA